MDISLVFCNISDSIIILLSVPLNPLKGFGIFLDLLLFKVKFKALYKVCKISVDLPLPETPVTQVKLPKGIFKFTLSFCNVLILWLVD